MRITTRYQRQSSSSPICDDEGAARYRVTGGAADVMSPSGLSARPTTSLIGTVKHKKSCTAVSTVVERFLRGQLKSLPLVVVQAQDACLAWEGVRGCRAPRASRSPSRNQQATQHNVRAPQSARKRAIAHLRGPQKRVSLRGPQNQNESCEARKTGPALLKKSSA